jgi:hypothetical protein
MTKVCGQWLRDFEGGRNMTDAAASYQSKSCNGRRGMGFHRNGIQFDGVNHNQPLLLEAKYYLDGGGMSRALARQSWWAGNKALEQAARQLKAAGGVTIEWRVAGKVAAEQLELLFQKNNVPIKVVYFPP